MAALHNLHVDDAHVDNASKIWRNEGYKNKFYPRSYIIILLWFFNNNKTVGDIPILHFSHLHFNTQCFLRHFVPDQKIPISEKRVLVEDNIYEVRVF